MASALTASISHSIGSMRTEWILERAPIDTAVSAVIGQSNPQLEGLPSDLTRIIVDYLKSDQVFGDREWTALCGRVAPAPALPADIDSIWQSSCPVFPGKKTYETHMLVYLPTAVDGVPLTLKSFGEIAKRYFPMSTLGYDYIHPDMIPERGDDSIGRSCWVLMTKELLLGSQDKLYSEQKRLVSDLAKSAFAPYEIPRVLEAAVCILSQYFSSRTRLLSSEPYVLTNCQEGFRGLQITVGAFGSEGLCIAGNSYASTHQGVVALRKL